MQPCSSAMQGGMTSITACLQELQNGQQQQQISNPQTLTNPHFEQSNHDDFLDQMLSIPSWTELSNPPKFPWELNPQNLTTTTTTATTNNVNSTTNNNQKLFTISLLNKPEDHSPENLPYYDESSLLASRLRQHQISSPRSQNSAAISSSHSPGKSMVLQLNPSQLLVSRGMAARSPVASAASCISDGGGLLPLPLTLGQGNHDASDTNNGGSEAAIQGLYNGFAATQQRSAQTSNQHFHPQPGSVSTQNYGAPSAGMNQAQAAGSAGCAAPGRQRVRARRGQATDPHSIAERLRRERIAERMKALQELVPNANKTDKASMLDEIIDYVKFLQLQVKVLSMSRLGGAAAIAPLVADMSSEGGDCIQASGIGWSSNGNQPSSQDSLTVTEHQVAKLMEEDMGSAMQYLQGKGLCLMPISLASAISTTTCHSRNPNPLLASNADAPPSPSMSVLTVQSAMANGADTDVSRPAIKDAASVSKP